MNKLTLLLFFLASVCRAQPDSKIEVPGRIVYVDGTEDVTFLLNRPPGSLPRQVQDQIVAIPRETQDKVYYLDKNSKMMTLYPKDKKVKEVHFMFNGHTVTAVAAVPKGGSSRRKFLEQVMDGPVKLYVYRKAYGYTESHSSTGATPNYSGMIQTTTRVKYGSSTAVYYFLQRGDGKLFASKELTFSKRMRGYFSDCQNLQGMIAEKHFTQDNIADMVEYYNKRCK